MVRRAFRHPSPPTAASSWRRRLWDTLRRCPARFRTAIRVAARPAGVCSIQLYGEGGDGRIGEPEAAPVITCPARFEQGRLIISWLADIVGFASGETMLAREIPFMQSIATNKPAGKIDMVIGRLTGNELRWYGLEIQAVYFSGSGMSTQFAILRSDDAPIPPYPDQVRRPDWRSSSAKRLMPQLQIKAPTAPAGLRRHCRTPAGAGATGNLPTRP